MPVLPTQTRGVKLWGAAMAVALLAVAALADPALAQDAADVANAAAAGDAAQAVEQGSADHGEGSGGLPQLNPASYASQIFWTAVTFGLLFWLMSKVALPRVAEVLEARQERITNDLEKATALKAEADGVLAAYEKAVADARSNAQAVMAETTAASDAEATRRNGELATDIAQRTRAAEERIRAATQAALGNVRAVAAETAQAAVERLVGVVPSPEQADAAVDAVMKERA